MQGNFFFPPDLKTVPAAPGDFVFLFFFRLLLFQETVPVFYMFPIVLRHLWTVLTIGQIFLFLRLFSDPALLFPSKDENPLLTDSAAARIQRFPGVFGSVPLFPLYTPLLPVQLSPRNLLYGKSAVPVSLFFQTASVLSFLAADTPWKAVLLLQAPPFSVSEGEALFPSSFLSAGTVLCIRLQTPLFLSASF